MGKRVRVFLDQKDLAMIANQKNCERVNQNCYFCDLLDCQQIVKNGLKQKVGTVRLFGKEVNVIYSPQEGCWLPSI